MTNDERGTLHEDGLRLSGFHAAFRVHRSSFFIYRLSAFGSIAATLFQDDLRWAAHSARTIHTLAVPILHRGTAGDPVRALEKFLFSTQPRGSTGVSPGVVRVVAGAA
jgi:hypothetical protein